MENCIFCRIIERKEPAYFVYEDDETIAFLDHFPQTRGHLQLTPKTHYRWIWELPNIGQFFTIAGKIIRVIIPVLEADHVTLATFGQQVPHAHLWIVPQYKEAVKVRERWDLGTGKGQLEVAELLKRVLAV